MDSLVSIWLEITIPATYRRHTQKYCIHLIGILWDSLSY
jgi:hypothetical protein